MKALNLWFPLSEFEDAAQVWTIFEACRTPGTDEAVVEQRCRDFCLPLVRLSPVEVRGQTLLRAELTTRQAGYRFDDALPEIEGLLRRWGVCRDLITGDTVRLRPTGVALTYATTPYLFRLLLGRRPQGGSLAALTHIAREFESDWPQIN